MKRRRIMKKFVAFVIVCCLVVFSCASAVTPSITIGDMISVKDITCIGIPMGTQVGEEMMQALCEKHVTDDGMIEIVFPSEAIQQAKGDESVVVILSL